MSSGIKRMFGMMPASEVTVNKRFRTDCGGVTCEAGPNGWTVIWADGSTNYGDTVDTAENNLQKAIDKLLHHIPEAEEIKKESCGNCETCKCES